MNSPLSNEIGINAVVPTCESDKLSSRFVVDDSVVDGAVLSYGFPFAQGLLFDDSYVEIRRFGGELVTTQRRVLSRWPDGSIAWMQLIWIADKTTSYELLVERSVKAESTTRDRCNRPENSLDGLDSLPLKLAETIIDLNVELDGGQELETVVDSTQLVFEGEIQSEYLLRGRLLSPQDEKHLDWFATIAISEASSSQRWMLTIRNPQRAEHAGGIWELGDRNSTLIRNATVSLKTGHHSGNGKQRLHYRLDEQDDWKTSKSRWKLSQLGSGGPNYNYPTHRDSSGNVRMPVKGYQLVDDDRQVDGERATPTVILERDSGGCLGLVVPRFWQNFPRVICWDSEAITLGVFPQESGVAHELLPGEQKTVEFCVATGSASEIRKRVETLSCSPSIRLDPDWVCRSAVIPWLTPRETSSSKEFLALVDQAVKGDDNFFAKRERIDEYGWRHFGEVFGDHEAVHSEPDKPLVSHYNNQYDVVLGLGLNYLRGGDAKFRELMYDLARHIIDIDIYHTDDDLACYNHGMFWHTVHYIDAGLATHRTYPTGTCGGGPSSGHAYSRGLLLYYYLTGDRTALEAVTKMGEWIIASEDGRRTKYRWLAGGETGLTTASGSEHYHGPGRGPGNAVEVLLTAYQATHERRFIDQAEHLIRRVVHPEQDIESLDLLDSEKKWFYLLFLQALGRYLEIKISMKEINHMYGYGKTTLLRFADWMADHEYPFLDKPQKLEFPTETWAAQDIRKVEVFQWAARHAKDGQRERFLERANFYFKTSIDQLNQFETKSCCRPVALLMSNGYSHDFFRDGGLETIDEAPAAPDVQFQPHPRFVSQKTRAIRNAKLAAGVASLGGLAVLVAGLAYLFQS